MRAVVSGVSILNTYVPQGRERASTHFTYKLEWFQRLGKLLEKSYSAAAPLIWCGDLNVAPESIDVHDPKNAFSVTSILIRKSGMLSKPLHLGALPISSGNITPVRQGDTLFLTTACRNRRSEALAGAWIIFWPQVSWQTDHAVAPLT